MLEGPSKSSLHPFTVLRIVEKSIKEIHHCMSPSVNYICVINWFFLEMVTKS